MSRIKLTMPLKIIGTVQIPVRITDINYGNHLGNDALVSILHEARVLWLKQQQYTELNAGGTGLIMGDLAVEYLNESFYGDTLTISIATGDITRVSFELYYLVETGREEKSVPVARAKTGLICYDYQLKKVVVVPEALKKIL